MASAETFTPKNLLIIGATGLIGKYITNSIVEKKADFGRIAIFTSPETVKNKADFIAGLRDQGVEIIEGDISNEDHVKRAYQGIDTVISCLGRGALSAQTPLIQLASSTPSVRRFYPSEYGTDVEYDASSATEKPHQQKLAIRKAVREASNLEYTLLVTGPFAEGYLGNSPLKVASGFNVKAKRADVITDPHREGKVSLTTMKDVGTLLVLSLQHATTSRNKALRVNSFTTTDAEIVREFERQTGGEAWTIVETPVEDIKRLETEAWEAGNPVATAYTLKRIWATGGTLYEKRDNYLIKGEEVVQGLKETVQEVVRRQLGGKSLM